jgi:hypothetical protein
MNPEPVAPQTPATSPPPNKSRRGLFIGLIVGGAGLLVIIIAVVLILVLTRDRDNSLSKNTESQNTQTDLDETDKVDCTDAYNKLYSSECLSSSLSKARQQDLYFIVSALTSYQSDNRGNLPTSYDQLQPYLKRALSNGEMSSSDFDGHTNIKSISGSRQSYESVYSSIFTIVTGAECDDGGQAVVAAKSTSFAILNIPDQNAPYLCQSGS